MGIKGRWLNSYPGSFKQSAIDEVLMDNMALTILLTTGIRRKP